MDDVVAMAEFKDEMAHTIPEALFIFFFNLVDSFLF